MKLYREKNTRLLCREGTLDEYVVKEQSSYRSLFDLCKGKTVLDIGGNIGAFAYEALKAGAERVVSFEPDPDNASLYRKQGLGSTLVQEAISMKSGTAKLFVNSGKNKGMHSLQEIQGREFIIVRTYPLYKAIKKYSPQVLKIDIEGGEYSLNLDHIPESVEAIAIEIHLNHADNRERGKALIQSLRRQFPKVLKEPNITDKNWTTLFIGVRK